MSRNRPSTCPPLRPRSANESHHATAVAGGSRSRCSQKPTVKTSIPKRGPPPAPPRKIDYRNPQMTRAMCQRLKHNQKYQEELERRERSKEPPIRRSRRPTGPPPPPRRPPDPSRPGRCPLSGAARRGTSHSREPRSRPGSARDACPGSAQVPEHTINLAKTLNADIVQAEPIQRGPVDNIIIPPGAINSEKTTIVSVPVTGGIASSTMHSAKGPNKSVQIINETLDEQDALESAVMNSKLQDLQHARRDLMMTVAGFGSNSLSDDSGILDCDIGDISPPALLHESPGGLYNYPEPDDPFFRPEYGLNHPVVEAAREYLRCRQSERKFEDQFDRIAGEGAANLDDIQPDFFDLDDNDYNYGAMPNCEPYQYEPDEVDQLERFVDTKKYPPCPQSSRTRSPPAGRKDLHHDLWDIEDPWYCEAQGPDLIEWNSNF